MFAVAKVLQLGVVGLTALMTLVAGMPRIDCVCPNGNIKVFCLKTLVGMDGCCCAEACCDRPAAPAEKSCCHCQGEPASGSHEAKQCPCHTKLTEATLSAIASSPEAPRQANAAGMVANELSPLPITVAESCGAGGSLSHPLPPIDLLATCKHLLI